MGEELPIHSSQNGREKPCEYSQQQGVEHKLGRTGLPSIEGVSLVLPVNEYNSFDRPVNAGTNEPLDTDTKCILNRQLKHKIRRLTPGNDSTKHDHGQMSGLRLSQDCSMSKSATCRRILSTTNTPTGMNRNADNTKHLTFWGELNPLFATSPSLQSPHPGHQPLHPDSVGPPSHQDQSLALHTIEPEACTEVLRKDTEEIL